MTTKKVAPVKSSRMAAAADPVVVAEPPVPPAPPTPAEPPTPEPAPDVAPARVSRLQEWLSPLRSLIDPKFIWSMVIAALAGAVLGYAMFESALTGAAFVLSIVGLTYVARTFAWPQINVGEFARKALETSVGAAIVLAALMIWCAVLSLAMISRAQAEAIPANAYKHLPTLNAEASGHWDARDGSQAPVALMAGLVDHETACPSPRTCWRTDALYKTKREEGVGLGMSTRAFNRNGTLRFDALSELKALHPTALRDANWEKNKFNPQLQARALVLKVSDNYNAATRMTRHAQDRLAFAVTMHNRGVAGVQNEAARCAITRGCDRERWARNVERTCTASRQIIPGTGRSACDISRAYWPDVSRRAVKYSGAV